MFVQQKVRKTLTQNETKMEFNYRGFIAPVFTPFTDDMVLNLTIIDEYANFLSTSGIKGILVNGTTGEGPSLSTRERKLVVEKWKSAVTSTKQHLMVQVGGAPLPEVLELARHAEKIGVDSLLCLPELYFKPKNSNDLILYLKEISEAAPKTPLLYYHIPSFSNVNIHMGDFMMNEMLKDVSTFCGIKFTSTCLDESLSVLSRNDSKYVVFLGADNVLAGAFTLGYDSAIATTLNIFPQISIDILNAINASDVKKAANHQRILNSIIQVITKNGSWVSTMKHAMNSMTPIKVGRVRKPLSNLCVKDLEEMEKALHSLV